MKKSLNYLIMGGVALFSLYSCQEDSMKTKPMPGISEEQIFTEAKKLELQAYQELSAKSREERSALFEKFRGLQNSGFKSSVADPTLSEAFLALEGLTNNDFHENWDDIEDMGIESDVFDIPFYVDQNGAKKVSLTEYNQAYTDIYNFVTSEMQADDIFLMVDLEIVFVDTIQSEVEVKGSLYSAVPPPVLFMTPGGPFYAAMGAGPCDGNPETKISGGTDAASFLNFYANQTADWRQLNCPNGIYTLPVGAYYTYNQVLSGPNYFLDPSGGTNTWNQVIANYWKSNTNDCIGYDNDEWYYWYGKMDNLANYGEVRAQNVNVDAEFYMTDYHSHDQQSTLQGQRNGSNPDISERYYHGGTFIYNVVGCL